MSTKRTRIHVALPHSAHAHHHPSREHFAHIPAPSFKLTPIKRYRLAKKPDKGEEHLLLIRNICVAVAAVLFLLAMVPHLFEHHVKYILRGVAYVFGAGALRARCSCSPTTSSTCTPSARCLCPTPLAFCTF